MKFTYLSIFLAFLFLASCNKDSFNLDRTTENGLNELLTRENSAMLPNGLGVQKINDNQTDESLIRGVDVGLPLFDQTSVEVKAGSWVTLRFRVRDLLEEDGLCPEELSEEDVILIAERAKQFLIDDEISIYFDGELIDAALGFRSDYIDLVYGQDPQTGIIGCYTFIQWRYYINPQSKGEHEYKLVYGEDTFTRSITWVPGEEEE